MDSHMENLKKDGITHSNIQEHCHNMLSDVDEKHADHAHVKQFSDAMNNHAQSVQHAQNNQVHAKAEVRNDEKTKNC